MVSDADAIRLVFQQHALAVAGKRLRPAEGQPPDH